MFFLVSRHLSVKNWELCVGMATWRLGDVVRLGERLGCRFFGDVDLGGGGGALVSVVGCGPCLHASQRMGDLAAAWASCFKLCPVSNGQSFSLFHLADRKSVV